MPGETRKTRRPKPRAKATCSNSAPKASNSNDDADADTPYGAALRAASTTSRASAPKPGNFCSSEGRPSVHILRSSYEIITHQEWLPPWARGLSATSFAISPIVLALVVVRLVVTSTQRKVLAAVEEGAVSAATLDHSLRDGDCSEFDSTSLLKPTGMLCISQSLSIWMCS
jgi:hypothetical protein